MEPAVSDPPNPCEALAAELAGSDHALPLLTTPLPCPPLELLVALHAEVRQAMLADPTRAQRAAAAAHLVAQQHPDDPIHHAQAHWSQGSAVLYLPDYAQALAQYDAALVWYERACACYAPLPPPRDVRAVHVVRIFCLSELGRYHEAQEAVVAAEAWLAAQPDPYIQLTLLLNRSQLAGTMGDYPHMVSLADATIALAMELHHPDRAAQGWINRANGCIALGRYVEADVAIGQALAFAEEANEPLTAARARCCRSWLLHVQGHLFAALSELQLARHGFAAAPGERAMLLLEEASILAQLQQWPEALAAAREAADLYASLQMPAYSAEAAVRAARIALQLGQASRARQLIELARGQVQSVTHTLLGPEIDLTEALLASFSARELSPATLQRRRRHARVIAGQAVQQLSQAGLAFAAAEGHLIGAALDRQLGRLEAATAGYARLTAHPNPALRIVAHGELGALRAPAEALEHLETAAQLVVQQRRMLPTEELQARYCSETAAYHMRLAACAHALGHHDRALSAIWEAKAGPILDLRAAATPGAMIAQDQLLSSKGELARLNRLVEEHMRSARLAAEQGQQERATYHLAQAQVAEAESARQQARLTAELRTLGDRGGQRAVPSRLAVQAALRPGSALLEWFQVDDLVFGVWLPHSGPPSLCQVTTIRAVSRLLDRWCLVTNRYQGAAQQAGEQALAQALAPLTELLLAPWRERLAEIDELVVAPCGVLYQLPWVALIAQAADEVAVTLTPSGGLWAADPEPPARHIGPPRALGHAGEGPGHLTHLEAELAAVQTYFPDAALCASATAAHLRAGPPPSLLHIAAHGSTSRSAPLCSTLELADGPFLLLEAHRLNLRGTALVVLSACETGVRPDHGDMVLALAGAFLCAGAGAVVASLWRVDDAATAALMERFYQALAQGHAPAQALVRAQRGVCELYPLDWAAFQLWAGSAIVAGAPLVPALAETASGRLQEW